VSAQPLVWLCAVALVLGAVGLVGMRRRDVGDLGPSRLVGAVRDRIVEYARESQALSRQTAALDTPRPTQRS